MGAAKIITFQHMKAFQHKEPKNINKISNRLSFIQSKALVIDYSEMN
jgi:hypothetical protein